MTGGIVVAIAEVSRLYFGIVGGKEIGAGIRIRNSKERVMTTKSVVAVLFDGLVIAAAHLHALTLGQ
jgi:hypothetical protein